LSYRSGCGLSKSVRHRSQYFGQDIYFNKLKLTCFTPLSSQPSLKGDAPPSRGSLTAHLPQRSTMPRWAESTHGPSRKPVTPSNRRRCTSDHRSPPPMRWRPRCPVQGPRCDSELGGRRSGRPMVSATQRGRVAAARTAARAPPAWAGSCSARDKTVRIRRRRARANVARGRAYTDGFGVAPVGLCLIGGSGIARGGCVMAGDCLRKPGCPTARASCGRGQRLRTGPFRNSGQFPHTCWGQVADNAAGKPLLFSAVQYGQWDAARQA